LLWVSGFEYVRQQAGTDAAANSSNRHASTDPITDLLQHAKAIAVVGLSNNPLRPSHGVAAYLQSQGYRVIPVNPNINSSLGEDAYPSLLEVPEKIDIVNIFRRSEFVEPIVDQAILLKIPRYGCKKM
jgi:predicted CoA-binding protein